MNDDKGVPYHCPACGQPALCGPGAHDEVIERRWLLQLERAGATAGDVISALLEMMGAHQADVSRRYGWPPQHCLDSLMLEDEPDGDHVVQLAGRLFRVRVEPIEGKDAERLRLRSIHDTDQQEAAIKAGTYFESLLTETRR